MKYYPLLFLGLISLAIAQEPANPETPLPGTLPEAQPAPGIPPTRVAKRLQSTPPDPNAIAVPSGDSIIRPEMTGADASQLYRKHTGKRVILTSQASQIQIPFIQDGPMTNGEVAYLLEVSLLAEGIAVVPDQINADIVRMVASGPAPGIGAAPLTYIDDPTGLPLTDQLVTYRMQFDNLKPDEALRVFQQIIGQSNPSGSITAVSNASSLIIKENAALVRQLIKIKEDIDIPVKITEAWVEVVYADVDEIAELLNEIYNERSSTNNTTRTTRQRAPLPGGTTNTTATRTSGSASGEDIPPRIIPDARTNRILLTGRPADLEVIKSLIAGFDRPSSPGNTYTKRLRFLRVGEFIGIAYDAIEATMTSSSLGGAGGLGGGRTTTNNRSTNSRANTTTNNRTTNSRTTGGAGGTAGGARTSLQEQDIPTAPEALPLGKTLLVADNVANAIIVNGPPHHIEIVRNLIEQLDTEAQQVVLSAVIGSYSLSENMNFGIDLARFIGEAGGDRGGFRLNAGNLNSVIAADAGEFANLTDLLTASGEAGSGLSYYGLYDDFGVFVNALEANTNFKSLNRPVITTRNNRVARISSGQRIAIPSGTSSFQGQNQTNVERENVELQLEIQPLINDDDKVTLEISLVRDSLGASRTVAGVGSEALNVPDVSTEELTTSVTVKNGAAIILGGLITEDFNDTKSGIPFLSRIPGIGNLFGNSGKGKNRSELVIILRPQIINNDQDYRAFQDGFEQDSEFSQEVRESLPSTGATMLPPNGAVEEEAKPKNKKSWWSRGGAPGKKSNTPRRTGAGYHLRR